MKNMMKILIVDDNKTFISSLKMTLDFLYEEIETFDLNDGKYVSDETLKSIDPDLIILDISMPVVGGLETLKNIRNNGHTVPVLILSMHDEKEYLRTAKHLGANGFLLKDSDIDLIKKTIDSLVKGENYFIKF